MTLDTIYLFKGPPGAGKTLTALRLFPKATSLDLKQVPKTERSVTGITTWLKQKLRAALEYTEHEHRTLVVEGCFHYEILTRTVEAFCQQTGLVFVVIQVWRPFGDCLRAFNEDKYKQYVKQIHPLFKS